jgi:hypothetical protein
MAFSVSFRLLLAILTSALPFESLLLRPACCCTVASGDQLQSSCCSTSQVGKAVKLRAADVPAFKIQKKCCQNKLAVDRNPIAVAFDRGSGPSPESPDYPGGSCLSDACSCGCQQACELIGHQIFVQNRDTEQIKSDALSGLDPFVLVRPSSIGYSNVHRRLFRPIALSSMESCARFCCWLI